MGRIQHVHAIAARMELEKAEKENKRLRKELGTLLEIVNSAPNGDELYEEYKRELEVVGDE